MKIKSIFTDERTKVVPHKVDDPLLDLELHLDSDEVRIYSTIPTTTRRKLIFIESSLVLDDGSDGLYGALFAGGDLRHTLALFPGEGYVIPVDGDVDNVTISNDTENDGKVRVIVL